MIKWYGDGLDERLDRQADDSEEERRRVRGEVRRATKSAASWTFGEKCLESGNCTEPTQGCRCVNWPPTVGLRHPRTAKWATMECT